MNWVILMHSKTPAVYFVQVLRAKAPIFVLEKVDFGADLYILRLRYCT